MENNISHLEDLKIIRKVMEESSRFLSLSGLSGIFAGIFALAGAAIAYFFILQNGTIQIDELFHNMPGWDSSLVSLGLIIDGLLVLVLAIGISLYFSIRKSRRAGLKIWTSVSKRMLINLLIPLISGGIFIITLIIGKYVSLIIPSMLIFYGMSLVNAGKFTFSEIFYLGLLEIVTGLVALFMPHFGLCFWAFGFGILHITYGLIMLGRYER